MENWFAWTIAGLVLAVGACGFSVVWWRFADRWAEDEQKRFGGQGRKGVGEGRELKRAKENEGAVVIKDFSDQDQNGEGR